MVVVDYRNHLADCDVADVGNVNQELVHGDSADDVDEMWAEQHPGLVGKTSPVAVGVSEGDNGNGGVAGGGE